MTFRHLVGNSSLPLQLIGCTLGWTKGTAVLDVSTGQPVNGQGEVETSGNGITTPSGVWEPVLFNPANQSDYNADPEIDSVRHRMLCIVVDSESTY